MEPNQKLALLETFRDISSDLLQPLSTYGVEMAQVSGQEELDSEYYDGMALPVTLCLKISVSVQLRGFDELFERFMGCLDGKEQRSVNEMRFLLDEIFENQAKMNAIADAREARLGWMRDQASLEKPPNVDLSPLSINDAIIMAESFIMFFFALQELFVDEYRQIYHMMARNHGKPKLFDGAPIRDSIGVKIERLESLGFWVDRNTKATFGQLHGL